MLGFVFDLASNSGKIHKGVTMQGIDVGGLTPEEAAVVLDVRIGDLLSDKPVELFASEELEQAGASDETIELYHASTTYQPNQDNENPQSWRISETTVGASFDAQGLAEEAYRVGRGMDLIFGRLKANLFGVDIPITLSYEQSQMEALEALFNDALGVEMRNADIQYLDGNFTVLPGSEGLGVDHESLILLLDQAFLGEQRTAVIPLSVIPVDISDEEAAAVAAMVQKAISQSITLIHGDGDSWTLNSNDLAVWIITSVEGTGEEAKLVPQVSEALLESGINDIIGERDPGTRPQDARFEVVDDMITIVPSVQGTGVNYTQVATDLNNMLFSTGGSGQARTLQLTVANLEPSFSTQQAEALHITDMISTYTTDYLYSSDAKIANIHLAADLINNSFIEPGGVWSFHDTAGECTAERGFLEAKAIAEGEYVDEIGGGICQVATTVFNTAFESGLPILERVNHGFYFINYPAGRDATVSWRWPDLKFENDTENWMLLTTSYTDSTITCTLWGTDPGYRVETEDTGFTDRTDFITKKIDNPDLPKGEERIKQEGVRGRTIIVTRYVYNKQGELIRKTDFKSVYEPETEIIEVGTAEVPKPNDGDPKSQP